MVPPEPNEAARFRRVMISQRMEGRGTEQTGRWVAAGAIDDEGPASVAQIQRGQERDGTVEIRTTFVLDSDAVPGQRMELRDVATLQPFPPPEPQHRTLAEGSWTVISGTGAYANLRADGEVYSTGTDRAVVGREITLVREGRRRRPAPGAGR
jgi:hypothetical protein